MGGNSRIWARVGAIASGSVLWQFLPSGPLWAQTVEDMESALKMKRGLEAAPGEPVMSLFTLLVLAAILLAMAIMFLMVRSEERSLDRPVGGEDGGERESYVMHVAFLATGYAAIIIMLSQLPPFMTPGLGSATRWVLIAAAVVISIAHVLAARDERALPPLVKYLFSGSVILAAFFFHLGFKQWSFLHFSDPYYYGKGPYIALGLILLLVLAYSAYITGQHFKKTRR
jgi:hypothetical protein